MNIVLDKKTYNIKSFTLLGTTTKDYAIDLHLAFNDINKQNQTITVPNKINQFGDTFRSHASVDHGDVPSHAMSQ